MSGFRVIPLSRGMMTIVDADVFEWASQYRWCAIKGGATFYAARIRLDGKKRIFVSLHRAITGATESQKVDHRNGYGLDNRRENLRVCTHRQNIANQRKSANRSSKYKGVSFHKQNQCWTANIHKRPMYKYLGSFTSELEAAHAYDAAAVEAFGVFARVNFPTDKGGISCLAQ